MHRPGYKQKQKQLTLFFILSLANPMIKLYTVLNEDDILMKWRLCGRKGAASLNEIKYLVNER